MASTAIRAKNKQDNKPSGAAGLPDGVFFNGQKEQSLYMFDSTGGNEVRVFIKGDGSDKWRRDVYFLVNGQFDYAKLPTSEGQAILRTISQISKHDVSKQPDGTLYETRAHAKDSKGRQRTLAYMKFGFSPPVGGKVGADQYAKVENGRLVPDLAKARITQQEAKQIRANLLRQKS